LISYRNEKKCYEGNPLLSLKQWFSQFPLLSSESELPFQGGAIGYISYDCVRYIEKIPSYAKDDLRLPQPKSCFQTKNK
jgi:para-aminobenzoate synthetase component 1